MQLSKPKGFFVTATDTDAGKTTVTSYLIQKLQHKGFKAIGCKPIACGLNAEHNNEDILVYQTINSINLPKTLINPICFDMPASPNIAAKSRNEIIKINDLINMLSPLSQADVDYIFYEGIGGWHVPLNHHETLADFAEQLQQPILLIVGLRVGCLNHALLTFESIAKQNVPLVGWIGNVIDPTTPAIDEHIATLRQWISAPYLGTLPFNADNGNLIDYINIDIFIN